MIFTLEARGNITLELIQKVFHLSDKQCTAVIISEFERLKQKLSIKGIEYSQLKNALIPAQKNRREIAFIFDSTKIISNFYGHEVFKVLIPAMDDESTYSILCGDIIIDKLSPEYWVEVIFEKLVLYHATTFRHPSQYFAVYINNLSKNQTDTFINCLSSVDFFIGYIDMTFSSILKSLISHSLVRLAIKNKKTFILSHEDDRDDVENVNLSGYDYESYGFNYKSINGMYFGLFLSYKIESDYPDDADVKYSFSAIKSEISTYREIPVSISNEKMDYLKSNKCGVLSLLGLENVSPQKLERLIQEQIRKKYIYNLKFLEEYSISKFNVSIELESSSGSKRKVVVALKYNEGCNQFQIVTLY